MPFSVKFFKGSLAGRRFEVGPGGLSVGRSHKCDVRPAESDVSGRHVSLAEAGKAVALTVESRHRTRIDGVPAKPGATVALVPGVVVELGSVLAFRVDAPSSGDDTDTSGMSGPGFSTQHSAGSAATLTGATFPGETDTSVPAPFADETRTEAPTVGPDSTADAPTGGGETAILSGVPVAGAAADVTMTAGPDTAAGGTAGSETVDGETQVMQTQIASREELDRIKEAFRKKKARKSASRFVVLALAAGSAVGLSLWMSMREPERFLEKPDCTGSWRKLVPDLVPEEAGAAATGDIPGFVAMEYPSSGSRAEIREFSENGTDFRSFEVTTSIGTKRDVELVLAADVFRDPAALNEPRADTFRRYLENSPEMHAALDNKVPLPDEDFFGGALLGHAGLRRGIPCSRIGYWLSRGDKAVYGVVSFFRFGEVCCAFRREVPATEQFRAEWLLKNTRTWLFAEGSFGAAQWEGAAGAGCADPKIALERCQAAFDLDTPSEWPALEEGLRNVLVETASTDGSAGGLHERAQALLEDVRGRKALHWKNLVAARVPVAASGLLRDEETAKALDASARESYPSPDEEWFFLARRERWWE